MTESEFKSTNVVMVTELTEFLCLKSVYQLLVVTHTGFKFGTKPSDGSRVKIPYFGTENIIVSVRHNMESRGIRVIGGQIKCVVAIDLQYMGKNIHLKVSKKKIHLAGALSYEMGEGAFNMVLEHIKMVNSHWLHIRSLDQETLKRTIIWIVTLLYRSGIQEPYKLNNSQIVAAFNSVPSDVDYRTAKYLSMFSHEHKTEAEFLNKINTIYTLEEPCYAGTPGIQNSTICNSVFHYNIGTSISLIQVCAGLHQMGYGVSYHNFNQPKKAGIMIPCDINEAPILKSTKKQKQRAHRLCLYQRGAVRQSSPTLLHEAKDIMIKFRNDINTIIQTKVSDPALSPTPSISSVSSFGSEPEPESPTNYTVDIQGFDFSKMYESLCQALE